MKTLIATIRPRSAFGGSIKGDTLFGQFCWAARHRWGNDRLKKLLEGYTSGNPFLVVSDAFPSGYLPRPAWPLHRYREVPDADRKGVKKRTWLPVHAFGSPLADWLRYSVPESNIVDGGLAQSQAQSHNTINRMTGTTGAGQFAPYVMTQHWFSTSLSFDLYIAHDERLEDAEITDLLKDIGLCGYGRDASIGLGKFSITEVKACDWPTQDHANAWMTLAPCAPQGLGFRAEKSFYRPFTRFGRHGDMAVHSGKPFKTPVLLADTGALLQPECYATAVIVGQGLGGDGSLSKAIPETVHQGYAPVLPVNLEDAS